MLLLAFGCTHPKRNSLSGLWGNVKTVTEISWDAKDILGEVIKGNLKSKDITNYDEKGNEIDDRQYRSDGILARKYIYKYDEKGIKMRIMIMDDELKALYEFARTQMRGVPENESEFGAWLSINGSKLRYHMELMAPGSSSAYDDILNPAIKDIGTNQYDEKGNVIGRTCYFSDGTTEKYYTYQYKFDKKGNWVYRIECENTIPIRITE
jgi:hypothetical protein